MSKHDPNITVTEADSLHDALRISRIERDNAAMLEALRALEEWQHDHEMPAGVKSELRAVADDRVSPADCGGWTRAILQAQAVIAQATTGTGEGPRP